MMLLAKVSVCDDPAKYGSIAADFICNRFDLIKHADFVLLKWQKGKEEYYVQASFEDNTAFLGIWLAPITHEILRDVSRFIYKKFKNVKSIEYRFGKIQSAKSFPANHFRIELPAAVDQLHARMTQKSRYNLRRSRRLLEESHGELLFEEYTSDNVPLQYVKTFLVLKKQSHGFVFDDAPEAYLHSHGITNIYVMKTREETLSVLLSCEQCRIVYLENLAYNPLFSQYSPGQLLYQYYLERLIEKKRKDLFLMGGDYEYKRRYGAIEETVYFGYLYKGFRANWRNIYKKQLRSKYKQLRHKIKSLLSNKEKAT